MNHLFAMVVLLMAVWNHEIEKAVLSICGASTVEELSEEEVERFRMLAVHPLDINSAGRSRLASCGLFTPFQVSSIIEYRSDCGDIISWTELSLVNGFNSEITEALRFFVRLDSDRDPGERERGGASHEIMVRGGVKAEEDGETKFSYGAKYSLLWGERAELRWATRTTYDNPILGVGTVSAAYYGKRWLGKIVAGDFSVRFGQGLTAWTGFSLSSLTTVKSFRRSATGLSPTSSFNSTEKGLGADFCFGRWSATAAWSFSTGTPYANICWTGKSLSAGISASSKSFSADFKFSVRKFSLFGEAAWDGAPAGVAGIIWSPQYSRSYGLMAKYTDRQLQAAAGAENQYFQLNFEAKVNYAKLTEQYRLQLTGSHEFVIGKLTLTPALWARGKFKPQESSPWRTDIRADIDAALDRMSFHTRFHAVFGKAFASASYIEAGFKGERFALWMRATIFAVDNWDDRIYVYERDVPGSFNVPALYGRGWSASAVCTAKLGCHALHLRSSGTDYFTDKPGKLEAKIQYSVRF